MPVRNKWIIGLFFFSLVLLIGALFLFLGSLREKSDIEREKVTSPLLSLSYIVRSVEPVKFFSVTHYGESHLILEVEDPLQKKNLLEKIFYQKKLDFTEKKFYRTVYFSLKGKLQSDLPHVIVIRKFFSHPEFALLIDDVGYKWKLLQKFRGKKMKISFAIFPFEIFSRKSADFLKSNGYQVLLHLPMEPFNYRDPRMIKGMLLTSMSREEIESIVEKATRHLGGVVGLNNHIGSKFTSDADAMKTLIDVLKEKNLFFIDSMTSPKSVGWKIAFKGGVPTARREVFIDNSLKVESIEKQWEKAEKLAIKRGEVLVIGHLHPQTVKVVLKKYPELEKKGITPVFVSDLLY